MDNNSSRSSFTQLTVNSLQGDSQLLCQDMPRPTEGFWAEGTSTDYNLFCWLEAIIAPMIMFLRGGHVLEDCPCPPGTTANGHSAALW